MEHKPGLFLIAIIVVLLGSCNSVANSNSTATPVTASPFLAPSSIVEPTDTPKHPPTATHPQLAPTSTATKLQSTQTTRSSCTIDQPGFLPTFAIPPDNPLVITDFEPQPILDFLNAGGSQQAVIDYIKKSERLPDEFLLQKDLTGDGIPELIVVDWHLRIYTCQNQKYYTAADIAAPVRGIPVPVLFQDMNSDGFPEILLEIRDRDAVDVSYDYQIIEWNGQIFQNLIFPEDYDNYTTHTYMMTEIMSGWVQLSGSNWAFDAGEQPQQTKNEQWDVLDTDHNGTQEVILNGGIFVDRHIELNAYGHQRKTKTTLMWDGKHFIIQDTEYGPAEFRFQEVQDADYATLKGQYNKALHLYQQVISSNSLGWWSNARGENNVAQAEASWNAAPTPTLPVPNLTEREYLSAYAYYRIMVLKVLQGDSEQAKTAFQTLRAKFLAGKPGYAYTELAAAFWNEYKTTQNIGNACHAAINYANANKSAILHYIGERNYHPLPSLDYQPNDICPFK